MVVWFMQVLNHFFCFSFFFFVYILWWFLRSIIYGFCKFLVITDTCIHIYLLCTSAIPSQALPLLFLLFPCSTLFESVNGFKGNIYIYIYIYIKRSLECWWITLSWIPFPVSTILHLITMALKLSCECCRPRFCKPFFFQGLLGSRNSTCHEVFIINCWIISMIWTELS